MTQICKIVTFFALILHLALSIQARLEPASAPVEETAENFDALYYAPSPYGDDFLYYAPSPYGDEKFPESPYPLDDMASELEGNGQYPPSPSSPSPAHPPGIEQHHPYNNGEYPSPSPAPYIDVMAPEVDDFYDDDYSPSEAPRPTDYGLPSAASTGSSMATPPPAEWEYRAEDDAEYLNAEDEDEEGYGEENKRGTIGLVIGAVCLAGLGGLVYKRRKTNQKRKHPVYSELSKSGDV